MWRIMRIAMYGHATATRITPATVAPGGLLALHRRAEEGAQSRRVYFHHRLGVPVGHSQRTHHRRNRSAAWPAADVALAAAVIL